MSRFLKGGLRREEQMARGNSDLESAKEQWEIVREVPREAEKNNLMDAKEKGSFNKKLVIQQK